jgi:hypothetical protein
MTDFSSRIDRLAKLFSAHAINSESNDRPILEPKVGSDDLFVEPDDPSPDRESVEFHNRERFANHFSYADPWQGVIVTYDPEGRYNCGRCNQADYSTCLLVKIKKLDLEAGSCREYETIRRYDAEARLALSKAQKDPDGAHYAIADNGKGYGCHRCPYAKPAIRPDSLGRELYCGKGDFRVIGTACCELNGTPAH